MFNWILIPLICMCGIGGPISTDKLEPAVRGEQVQLIVPPTVPVEPIFDGTSYGGVCVGLIPLLEFHSPGWDTQRMAKYAYRESRCQPGAHNSAGAQGLFQITRINYPYLSKKLGVQVNDLWLRDPVNNVRAAAWLYIYWDGYSPWTCCT